MLEKKLRFLVQLTGKLLAAIRLTEFEPNMMTTMVMASEIDIIIFLT